MFPPTRPTQPAFTDASPAIPGESKTNPESLLGRFAAFAAERFRSEDDSDATTDPLFVRHRTEPQELVMLSRDGLWADGIVSLQTDVLGKPLGIATRWYAPLSASMKGRLRHAVDIFAAEQRPPLEVFTQADLSRRSTI